MGFNAHLPYISLLFRPNSEEYKAAEHFRYSFSRIPASSISSFFINRGQLLTLLHSEGPKLYTILAFLSAVGLKEIIYSFSPGSKNVTNLQFADDIDALAEEK